MQVRGTTRLAAVIGAPVQHSLSPVICNAAFSALGVDWVYGAFEVAPGRADAALDAVRTLGLGGLSVTMPHKDQVAASVDRLSPEAQLLGAVNCVVHEPDGHLVGHNTDGQGFVASLVEVGFDPAGKRCMVLGAGGSARAVVLALAAAGAAEVAVVNRTASRAHAAVALAGPVGRVAQADEAAEHDLVVNATPAGMTDDRLPLDPLALRPGQTVADLVYHPATTPLLAAARERGAVVLNGLGMLVHQAVAQIVLWTGQVPDPAIMRAAADAELATRPT